MSETFRVLIVDDHQEIRTVLRAALETLEADLDILDAPSAEEAIVEVVGTGIDLLIADVGLPGLSGLELYQKLKATYEEMQVIIITGIEDEEIHQEIADLKPEASFFKPLNMPEFLNAVRVSMGLDPVEEESEDLPKLTKKNLHKDVTDRIADLRGELGAIAILVLETSGIIAAETGILPDNIYLTHVLPSLLKTTAATKKISSYLGKEKPESTWYFEGDKYDHFWSTISHKYSMVIITNPIEQKNDLTWVLTTVQLAVEEVSEIITTLEEKPARKSTPEKTTSKKKATPKTTKGKKSSSSPAKADLPKDASSGDNGSAKKAKSEVSPPEEVDENEVHEFWKAATLEEEIIRIDSPDSLTFEQAQKLGFIPDGENPDD
jgi:two-component system KDP operon response regulator KdpE